MKIFVCLDDKGGMMFNNRRQSRDRVLMADMKTSIEDSPLLVSPCSEKLVREHAIHCTVYNNPLACAGENDFCFIEDIDASDYVYSIDTVIIYKWNKRYPADVFFNLDMSEFKLVSVYDFEGYSHEKITKEVYKR